MTDYLTAIPVVKNKFWVVEQQGKTVATIQAKEDGGFAFVKDQARQYFSSMIAIKKQYNIKLTKSNSNRKTGKVKEIYGFPCRHVPHMGMFNLQRQLPIYSLNEKSKSYYCAGYYLIKHGKNWLTEFCPKLITLNRYEYLGPFHTQEDMRKALGEQNNES
jgi:hypothetical protein